MKKSNLITLKKSALSSAILCAMGSAQAATITVDDNCSLLEAMQTANSDLPVGTCAVGSGADVIQVVTADSGISISTSFEPSASGPGAVGLPVVASTITIEGNGLTISANNNVENFRLFEVGTGGDLTLRDTTVTNANDGYGVGSGLFNYGGRVTIENSTFALNNGGILIANSYGNEITNSVIRHNTNTSSFAAGLQSLFAEVDISHSSFIDNNHYTAGLIRGGSVIAGGAGLVQSEVTISDSTFSGNESLYGSAVFINDEPPLHLPSSLARFGDSPLRGVINSEVTIINSTITNNKGYLGSGIFSAGSYSTVTLQGSIVSGNDVYSGGFAPNIFSPGGPISLDANNIIGDNGNTGSYGVMLGASDSSFSNYAKDNLYPLTLSNGQLMHPLKVGSSAIDANDLSCNGSITDQEGKGRGIDGDNNGSFICDVGAFEHSLAIIANDAPCTFSNAMLSAEIDASVGGCQPGNGHDIVVLNENSTQTFDAIVDTPQAGGYFNFGMPRIETAVTIEANGSTFERDAASLESFDLFYVEAGGQLNLIDAHVTGANGGLGAVAGWYGGNMNVINSNISGNNSTAIFDFLSINSSVINTTVNQNISNSYGLGPQISPLTSFQSVGFELRQSTISNNIGNTGGGVDFRGVILATMDNTTVSGNIGYYAGGMIMTPNYSNQKMATIRNLTITGNTGTNAGGIYSISPNETGLLTMSHSVVSGNELAPPPPPRAARNTGSMPQLALPGTQILGGGPTPTEIYSTTPYLDLNAYNIIGQNGDAGTVNAVIGVTDIVPAGPTSTVIDTTLADNGGATMTHMPEAAGPAVDGGDSFCGLNEDQLGQIRPWDGDNDGSVNCDIGSVEFGSVLASDIIFKDGFEATIIIRRAPVDD